MAQIESIPHSCPRLWLHRRHETQIPGSRSAVLNPLEAGDLALGNASDLPRRRLDRCPGRSFVLLRKCLRQFTAREYARGQCSVADECSPIYHDDLTFSPVHEFRRGQVESKIAASKNSKRRLRSEN